MKFAIAIDGPAASGKSSAAELVAKKLGFERVDSGMFYRAITYLVYKNLRDFNCESTETRDFVNSLKLQQAEGRIAIDGIDITDNLRTPFVDSRVGMVSKELFVRKKAHEIQYSVINSILDGDADGIVVDGRDIGTVVLPDAFLKVFITAKETTRAKRRSKQTGQNYDKVLEEIRNRDQFDLMREHGPLKLADDAFLVENDSMGLECTVDRIIELFSRKSMSLDRNKLE